MRHLEKGQDMETFQDDLEQYCIVDSPSRHDTAIPEPIRDRIERVREDIKDITMFYNISISPARKTRLQTYYKEELASLSNAPFDSYDQEEKIDYLLLQNYLEKGLRQTKLDTLKDQKMEALLPFAKAFIQLCEDRQKVKPVDAQKAAQSLHELSIQIAEVRQMVMVGKIHLDRASAFRATKAVEELRHHLEEWFGFYNAYDPMTTWWAAKPYAKADDEIEKYVAAIHEVLLGIQPGDENVIIGDPIGRDGLVADLRAELIPYTPEELLKIGDAEYAWCEAEMKKASRELGYGVDWRKALEHVKTLFVDPGQQTQLVKNLSKEATEYVIKHDLITVPPLAAETIRMHMMTPERQLVNPFFLGGDEIIVSYPTNSMDHEAKLMSMRGNNIHFSRSTVFHELIPGHHLQLFMNARHRPYRQMFETCFSIEGWAFYWEMILWDDAHFPKTPENRIGMLFWRLHRCCRIMFSLNFHLGKMTPQECIDLLVNKGGHERATAEGEVRRSFAGDYPPLYQAGYMLGALQLYALRKELVGGGVIGEKQLHDRIMREGQMPIELLRALMKKTPLSPKHKATWKFYSGLQTGRAAAED